MSDPTSKAATGRQPLTSEQERMLDELVSLAANHPTDRARPSPQVAVSQAAEDWLQTWFGVSFQDVQPVIQAFIQQKDNAQQRLIDWVEANPLDASLEFLTAAAWAFYLAEKDENPKITSYVDAFYYISTCASVGYADIFAVTQTGRAIASLVMIVGPAMAAHSLDRAKNNPHD